MSDGNATGQGGFPIVGVKNGWILVQESKEASVSYDSWDAFQDERSGLMVTLNFSIARKLSNDEHKKVMEEAERRLEEVKAALKNGQSVSYSLDKDELLNSVKNQSNPETLQASQEARQQQPAATAGAQEPVAPQAEAAKPIAQADAPAYPYVTTEGSAIRYYSSPHENREFSSTDILEEFLQKRLNSTENQVSSILEGLENKLGNWRDGVAEEYQAKHPRPSDANSDEYKKWAEGDTHVQKLTAAHANQLEPVAERLKEAFDGWFKQHNQELQKWVEKFGKELAAKNGKLDAPFSGFVLPDFSKSDAYSTLMKADIADFLKPEKLEEEKKKILGSLAGGVPVQQQTSALDQQQTVMIGTAPGGLHTEPSDPYDKPGNREKYWWLDNERNIRAYLEGIKGFEGLKEDESKKGVFTASLGHLGEFTFERTEPGVRSGSVSLKTPEFKEEHAKFLVNMAFMNLPPGSRSVVLTGNPPEAAKQTYMLLLKKGFDVSVAGINPSAANDWKAEYGAWAASHQAEAMQELKEMRQHLSAPPAHDPQFVPKPDGNTGARPTRGRAPVEPQWVGNPLDQQLGQQAQMQQRPRPGPAPGGAA